MAFTTEELLGLGLTKEQADKVLALRGKEIANSEKEKADLTEQVNSLTAERDGLQTQLSDRDKDIKSLKKASEGNEELKTRLSDLENKYKTETENLQAQLQNTRLDSAVTTALSKVDARNPEDLIKFLDRETIKLADDGTVQGLDEQIQSLKESKAYLFKTEPQTTGTNPTGGGGANHVNLAAVIKDPNANLTELLQKQGE